MNILVTGAYGQLGSELGELAEQFSGWNFMFTDVDTLDITDREAVEAFFIEKKPDFVVNCAAYTAVDRAENEPEKARLVNAIAPSILAEASKKRNSGFIHISTDYVFGGDAFLPYSETDTENPSGVYGKTKREGEVLCREAYKDTLIIRTSWLYSSFGNNFVKTMLRLGREKELVRVVFDQVGSPTYAADLAKAVCSIIQIYENDRERYLPGIYHFSNEGVASWYDFARAVFELRGIDCPAVPVLSDAFPVVAKRPHFSVLNKSKIKDKFNLEIPYWRDSLKVCLKKITK